MATSPQEVTRLLAQWRDGDAAALDRLIPLVYDELRRIASRCMKREREGHTLQTTAVIHEAYLRLAGQPVIDWKNRAHFFAVAARVMRHLLVDRARARNRVRRGIDPQQVSLDEAAIVSEQKSEELLALDEALTKLASVDERKARIVELRHFAGLSSREAAEALDISEITVKREWLKAKAWLFRELTEGTTSET